MSECGAGRAGGGRPAWCEAAAARQVGSEGAWRRLARASLPACSHSSAWRGRGSPNTPDPALRPRARTHQHAPQIRDQIQAALSAHASGPAKGDFAGEPKVRWSGLNPDGKARLSVSWTYAFGGERLSASIEKRAMMMVVVVVVTGVSRRQSAGGPREGPLRAVERRAVERRGPCVGVRDRGPAGARPPRRSRARAHRQAPGAGGRPLRAKPGARASGPAPPPPCPSTPPLSSPPSHRRALLCGAGRHRGGAQGRGGRPRRAKHDAGAPGAGALQERLSFLPRDSHQPSRRAAGGGQRPLARRQTPGLAQRRRRAWPWGAAPQRAASSKAPAC